MTNRDRLLRGVLLLTALSVLGVTAGCATRVQIPDNTLQLREVVHLLTRQEILTGNVNATTDNREREPIKDPGLYQRLLDNGYADSELVDGSVMLGRTQFYRHNAASGIVRQYMGFSTVPPGLTLNLGNLVEVSQRGDFSRAVRVRFESLEQGQCEYRLADRSGVRSFLDAVNPIGGPAVASLYCPFLESEAWGPAVHAGGGTEWFKPPLIIP